MLLVSSFYESCLDHIKSTEVEESEAITLILSQYINSKVGDLIPLYLFI